MQIVKMLNKRTTLSKATVGICFSIGFLVYLNNMNQLIKVGQKAVPADFIRSRISMNNPAGDGSDLSDTNINSSLARAIDNMVNQLQSTGPDVTEKWVQEMSKVIAKQIADYVVQKIGLQSPSQGVNNNYYNGCWKYNKNVKDLPIIYLVTPTYRRPEQIPDLTRLAQTLLNVPAVHWIVVEDSMYLTPDIVALLTRYGIPHTHLKAQMPEKHKNQSIKPKGVINRNKALDWVRNKFKSGVVYFADDDNTYDIRLFEEMRYTKKVSMWPVGLLTSVGLSSPVVDDLGVVVDFFDGYMFNRKFPVDTAGFAVSVQYLLKKPKAYLPYIPGGEEDGFLRTLDISPDDIEPKADLCTKILVWHTRTNRNNPANRTLATSTRYKGTNIDALQKLIV